MNLIKWYSELMPKRRPVFSGKWGFSHLIALMGLVIVLAFVLLPNSYLIKKEPLCANSISCTQSFGLKVENNVVGIFNGQKITPPQIDLAQKETPTRVLGDSAPAVKRVEVDLTTQTLKAYEGDKLFMETLISSGKWFPTPPGEYDVWVKLRATRMSGGEGADYYDLPNVPYVMFFYNKDLAKMRGFALHGAYWHNNFGHPMSHGCVNMRIVDAQKLYDWINPPTKSNTTYADKDNPGAKVIIYGQAP